MEWGSEWLPAIILHVTKDTVLVKLRPRQEGKEGGNDGEGKESANQVGRCGESSLLGRDLAAAVAWRDVTE